MLAYLEEVLMGPFFGDDHSLLDFREMGVGVGKKAYQLRSHLAEKDPNHHVEFIHPDLLFSPAEHHLRGVGDDPQESSDAHNDQKDRKDLSGRSDWMNIPIAHRGHRNDTVVEGIDQGPVLNIHEADRPEDQNSEEDD